MVRRFQHHRRLSRPTSEHTWPPIGTSRRKRRETVTNADLDEVVLTWAAPAVLAGEPRAPVTRYEIQWQQNDAVAGDVPATAADDLAGWADATIVSPTPPD